VPALIAALIVTVAYISFPLMLRQPRADLIATSALVDKVAVATTRDSRFAIAAPGYNVLPPNLNGIFGVNSIHSYNSLSSRRYQALIRALGGEIQTYGRWNGMIAPDYNSQAFWMSNISLMISPTTLSHPNLVDLGDEGALHLYRVADRMGCCLQIAMPEKTESDEVEFTDHKGITAGRPLKTRDEGDLLEFDVQDQQSSLLVLSQQYHARWHAAVRGPSGWNDARTVPVAGVFQGVVLPAGTQSVRLPSVCA